MKESVKNSSEFKIFSNLVELGLIEGSKVCEYKSCKSAGHELELDLRKRKKNDENHLLTWRCKKCTNYKSVYSNSFFGLFRKPVKIILAIIKCWATQLTISKTIDVIELNLCHKVTEKTVGTIFYRLRQVCSLSIDKPNILLGGVGKIIEIDESLYAKVKHWTGKDLQRPQVWVFGLVERNDSDERSSQCYMQVVKDREANTLVPIIYDKCKSGSIIYSDCWASYNKISKFKNFTHKTVNHSLNFIDPDSGACTNKIESLWNACKHKFKEMHGCKRLYIQSYIDEYLWRYNNNVCNDRKSSYDLILKYIAKYYQPGTELNNFEKIASSAIGIVDTLDETEEEGSIYYAGSCSNSDSGSEVNSDILGSLNSDNEDFGNLNEFEEDESVTGSGSSTQKNTVNSNNALDDTVEEINIEDSDMSHHNDDEQDLIKVARYYTTNEEKIDQINSQLSNVALSDLKYRSLVFEKKALEQPKSSKETVEKVKKVLSNKRNPVECLVCGKYFEEKGLKTHMTRMHK
ncbi:unnamed protein product [Brachionus calyciflorus]|uniref:ISXO2-like transposase domain-containing protein n=1 Tax=Brachionus calyciflorus TaxID=104777 RepID=A0A814D6H3_9BILA|nr:unnamed protein product [Brachionus calyciflorus]